MPYRFVAVLVCIVCLGGWVAQQAPAPQPVPLTAADLQKLKWIEGSWRGTGGGVQPFFERYRLEHPTTLVMESFKGETITGTSRFELKNGALWSAKGDSVATAFDGNSVTFTNVKGGSYKWERVSDNAWRAVITWPASGTRQAGERIYQLERIK